MQPLRIIDTSSMKTITKHQRQINENTQQNQHIINTEPTQKIFVYESEQTHDRVRNRTKPELNQNLTRERSL